jgi:tripartite-type tricarboxylate transporter receptor subunit TctC
MKLPRRAFLHLAAGAAALPATLQIASAQSYPTRPVRIIVGFPAGTTPDVIARLAAQWLSERLGQQFAVENRPGASSNLAAEAVIRAPPDGYTLLFVTAANAINATLYENLNFDLGRDIVPVTGIVRVPNIMEVSTSFPARTVPEFIAYAKANPGKINMASPGNGTTPRLTGELFKMMTGIDMTVVTYRENPMPDLLAGRTDVYFGSSESVEYIRTGKLRALAVTSAQRSPALPDVPAVSEFVPGYEGASWEALGAPSNTAPEIVEKLNAAMNAGLADAGLKARFADLGGTPLAGSSAELGKFIAEDIDKWRKVIKFFGIKAE